MMDQASALHNQQVWAELESLGFGQRFLYYFTQLSSIPRGSGNTKAVSDYCAQFARDHQLRYVQDEYHNIIMYQDGTDGYQNHPPVIIQGHLDMVCVHTPDCPLNMETEGLRLRTDGDWLWADGTTLGADDGIAVAYALAILESGQIPHPPLEVVFTTDEETGMGGAHGLDPELLQGRVLLNLDSEEEGVFTAGCSGGSKSTLTLPVRWEEVSGVPVELKVTGLLGGHSGMMIAAGRANACILLGQLLNHLSLGCDLRLVSAGGGEKDNAIPAEASAQILVPKGAVAAVQEGTAQYLAQVRAHYQDTDPGLEFKAIPGSPAATVPALDRASTKQLIRLLTTLPYGVQAMMADIPGLPQTSCNPGVLRLSETEATLLVSVRSSVKAECRSLSEHIARLAGDCGGTSTDRGAYPPWEYRAESHLRDVVAQLYPQVSGSPAVFNVIHAGVECGILYEKLPGLDALSFGPTILDIHSPKERFQLASVQRTWQFLLRLLENL